MTPEQKQLWASLDVTTNTVDDWRDLYETIEAWQRRRIVRAIVAHPQRDQLVAMIRTLAGNGDE